MEPFIELNKIQPGESKKLKKLKKKFNQCASKINYHCEGYYLSGSDKIKLLHELYEIGNEINNYE